MVQSSRDGGEVAVRRHKMCRFRPFRAGTECDSDLVARQQLDVLGLSINSSSHGDGYDTTS